MENRDYAIIGENIRRLRKENNYTQESFAEKLRISVKHVSRIENAEAYISLSLLLKIKHFFSVDANELLEPYAGKKNKMPTERRKQMQEKSLADIEAFFAVFQERKGNPPAQSMASPGGPSVCRRRIQLGLIRSGIRSWNSVP